MKTEYHDDDFGTIPIRRPANARFVKIAVTPNGQLTATLPRFAPMFALKKLLNDNRQHLKDKLAAISTYHETHYKDGQKVGSSHKIILKRTTRSTAVVRGQLIIWNVPHDADIESTEQQDIVRRAVKQALEKEARAYLPRQLAYLAEQHGFRYEKIRYGNAKGRWGSCSSRGTISLNIALMNMPHHIIDYVLVHELCHTKHLDHSKAFWREVERCYPSYKAARKVLKTFSPYL